MKKIMKKNQVIITSLAILIAVAGYLNFADVDLGFKDQEASTDSSSNASAQIAINPTLERTTVIIALFIDITSIRLYRSFKLCASVYSQFFLLLQ